MKDHIHTIPVLDALRQPEACPFCVMRRMLTQNAVEFIMGTAYMEDDIRMETNKRGFCATHVRMMYEQQNRLGLALMLHTYMQRLNADAAKNQPLLPLRLKKAADVPGMRLRGLFEKAGESCYLCDKIDRMFDHYLDTFFMLWVGEREAQTLVAAVPGYCLPHFAKMAEAAERKLSKSKLAAFMSVVTETQRQFMQQMEADLSWFTLKFDYRNVNEPWKNAKDALPRAMAMLHGADGEWKRGADERE